MNLNEEANTLGHQVFLSAGCLCLCPGLESHSLWPWDGLELPSRSLYLLWAMPVASVGSGGKGLGWLVSLVLDGGWFVGVGWCTGRTVCELFG